ncbi:TM2 domain-containing protein [uncultured Phascolarctobacterium sp.]|jgi:TM2 domain-containing membrane protein YozV|uniref:TM2 domain-containing protein n=1 Tax=uncultured Phascolarctobacterium sp. TaxID=512296 RepID=UPI0025F5952B|nr:TM2 domain-containing protein [uncultured Phascolarctobacterium sp.]
MAKIIKVENGIVIIGMDNGTLKEVKQDSLTFYPEPGTLVDVFSNEEKIIITKKDVRNYNNTKNGVLVNKTSYILFAILLGGFGIHKFYAHKILIGIVYAIFCWTFIPPIIGLVEGILAASQQADENGNIIV